MEIPPRMSRTAMLIGEKAVRALMSARVAIFGLGGVGGALCEALARAGVGNLTLIDNDTIVPSNINRQTVALHSTLGGSRPRLCAAHTRHKPRLPGDRLQHVLRCRNSRQDWFFGYDYIADAIDTLTSKLLIAARQGGRRSLIAAMGTGNKLDPTRLEIADISKTDTCPLARVIRRELRARGIEHLEVVFSREPARARMRHFMLMRRLPPAAARHTPWCRIRPGFHGVGIVRRIIENRSAVRRTEIEAR